MIFAGNTVVLVSTTVGRAASISHNIDDHFKIQQVAQDNNATIEFMCKYKQGIKTYDAVEGDGVNIILMKDLKIIKETNISWICTYTNYKGKIKKQVIPKVFDIDLNNLNYQ